jgi:hypothetical protein
VTDREAHRDLLVAHGELLAEQLAVKQDHIDLLARHNERLDELIDCRLEMKRMWGEYESCLKEAAEYAGQLKESLKEQIRLSRELKQYREKFGSIANEKEVEHGR